MNIPCGRCIGCRLERARQWAFRCWHEAQMHDSNIFLTLTYRDDVLPWGHKRPTLAPRDLQLFWKKLRKEYGTLRYFACGEYGEHTHRPHYHACIFGLNPEDKKYYTTKGGNRLYSSDTISRIWSYGNAYFGDVTFESASYVARYIVGKKLGEQSQEYKFLGIEPEFVRMSRRPGIGASWLDKYQSDVFPNDSTIIRGGIETSSPRFYRERLKKMDPLLYEQVAYVRAIRARESQRDEDNSPSRLKVRERIKLRKLKDLPRNSI